MFPIPQDSPRSIIVIFNRVALAALLAVLLYYGVELARFDMQRVATPYIISGVEPQPVAGALRIVARAPLYDDYIHQSPHIPLTYGPLFYWMPGMMARMAGIGDALGVLKLGRELTLFAMLGAFAMIALLAREGNRFNRFALAAPLWLIAFPYLMVWSARFSPDALALACSLAGWWLARQGRFFQETDSTIQNIGRKPQLFFIAAGFFWTACFFLKPTFIAGPIGYFVESAMRLNDFRIKRTASRLIPFVVALVSVFLTALLLNSMTGGLWWRNQVTAMTVCRTSPMFLLEVLKYEPLPFKIVFAAMAAMAAFNIRRQPLFIAFFIALAADLLMMTKQGSDIIYLLGSLSIWAIASVPMIGSIWGGESGRWLDGPWVVIVLTALLFGAPHASFVTREMPVPSNREIARVDETLHSDPPASVLALDPFYGLVRGLPILYADSYHISLLAGAGRLHLRDELTKIRAEDYSAIVTNHWMIDEVVWHGASVLPPGLKAAIESGYRPEYTGRWLVVWRRRLASPEN